MNVKRCADVQKAYAIIPEILYFDNRFGRWAVARDGDV